MIFMKNYRKRMMISMVLITFVTCISIYYFEKNTGYEIKINDKSIGYIEDKEVFKKTYTKLQKEIKERFPNVNIRDEVSVYPINSKQLKFIKEEKIKEKFIENSITEVEAPIFTVDNKEICFVAKKEEGNRIINKLKDEYVHNLNIKNVRQWSVKNRITYSKRQVKIGLIPEVEKSIQKLKMENVKNKKPTLTFEIVGEMAKKEVIAPTVVIEWNNSMLKGEEQVTESGKPGIKFVSKEVTIENNRILNEKTIKEEILEEAKDRVLIRGNKNPIVLGAAFLSMPSRGSFSSEFGIREGKMHTGVDIAAPMGTPIYAALEGRITYAGWEDGYGNIIKIKHGDELETYYGHCNSMEAIVGQYVEKGEKVGTVGSTGRSTGPHVHFEVRFQGEPKDPMSYLK